MLLKGHKSRKETTHNRKQGALPPVCQFYHCHLIGPDIETSWSPIHLVPILCPSLLYKVASEVLHPLFISLVWYSWRLPIGIGVLQTGSRWRFTIKECLAEVSLSSERGITRRSLFVYKISKYSNIRAHCTISSVLDIVMARSGKDI